MSSSATEHKSDEYFPLFARFYDNLGVFAGVYPFFPSISLFLSPPFPSPPILLRNSHVVNVIALAAIIDSCVHGLNKHPRNESALNQSA